MEHGNIIVDRQDRLTTFTINRPGAYNALDPETQLALEAALDAFEADDEQWVAIITGAGEKAFCCGLDLKSQAATGEFFATKQGFGGITARFSLTKPVIAAVNGAAMGGGFEIALACDIIVASENAVFALPEPRVGLAALGGGLQRLPRELGLKRAMGMMLTGRRLTAREGLEVGFVNEVVAEDALTAAKGWAADILACSPMAIRATKEAVLRGLSTSVEEGVAGEWEFPAMKAMLASQDAIEGPSAFSEKRSPVWLGK